MEKLMELTLITIDKWSEEEFNFHAREFAINASYRILVHFKVAKLPESWTRSDIIYNNGTAFFNGFTNSDALFRLIPEEQDINVKEAILKLNNEQIIWFLGNRTYIDISFGTICEYAEEAANKDIARFYSEKEDKINRIVKGYRKQLEHIDTDSTTIKIKKEYLDIFKHLRYDETEILKAAGFTNKEIERICVDTFLNNYNEEN